jgi:hypothetical protein
MSAKQADMDSIIADVKRRRIEAQQRAYKVLEPYGADVPVPMERESEIDFRCRALDAVKPYAPACKDVVAPREESALKIVEEKVYADAARWLTRPEGPLREVKERDSTGRVISRFYGDPADCWDHFSIPPRLVTGWRKPSGGFGEGA